MKRNLMLIAAYIVALVFMALPFTLMEASTPATAMAELGNK